MRNTSPSLQLALPAALILTLACDEAAAVRDGGVLPDAGAADAADDAPADAALGPDTGPMEDDASTPTPIPVLVGSWGGYGTEPGLFVEPSSIELDSVGFVIVAGHEDRVQWFTPDGELVAIWGMPGAGPGQFNHPHGLALDRRRGDLVYVGDQENHRLQLLARDGTFIRQWGDERFRHIHDVGIDPSSGDLYVGDYELGILRRFSATGETVAELGGPGSGPGQFSGVWGISTDSEGNVYVADTFNQRVQKLDRDGEFVAEWTGFMKPTGVFVDANDVVHVCDSLAESVVVLDRDGNVLTRWDLREILGAPSEPEDIVIDATGTHVYIAEVSGHRVYHLRLR